MEEVVSKLQKLGLTEAKAKETVKNKTLTNNLVQLLGWATDGFFFSPREFISYNSYIRNSSLHQ